MQARFFHALPFHLSITPEARLWRLHSLAKATPTRVPGDHQIFVGRDRAHDATRFGRTDSTGVSIVTCRIEFYPEKAQSLASAPSHLGGPLDRELNHLIQHGEILKAFEHYSDDVTMQENGEKTKAGKADNRARALEFLASVETLHRTQLLFEAVHDDLSFSEWISTQPIRGSGVRFVNK